MKRILLEPKGLLISFYLVHLLFFPYSSAADPLDNWHWRNPVPAGSDLTAISYGNGVFVAVGVAGTILTSSDGATWTKRASGVTSDLAAVTHGNNTFVVVGANGTILSSPDGVTWTERNSGVDNWLQGVTYGNDIFVAVGGYRFDCYTPPFVDASVSLGCVPGGSCCPALVLTSVDGITWTAKTIGQVVFGLTGVAYGNGRFVAVASGFYDSGIFISSDGVDWTSSPGWLTALTYGDGIFVGMGPNNTVQTSPDGMNWTAGTSALSFSIHAITYGNGTFVGVDGMNILTSPDGVTWTQGTTGLTDYFLSDLQGATYGNGIFVAVGQYGAILTSPDAKTWTSRISRVTSDHLGGIAYGNGIFVAVGASYTGAGGGGTIVTSPDEETWTLRSSGRSSGNRFDLFDVAYGNGTFVAVGYDYNARQSGALASPDGVTWTKRTLLNESNSGIAYGNGIFIAVGYNAISTSQDGLVWRNGTARPGLMLYAVTYGNGTFVAVGSPDREGVAIITSEDGANWTPSTSPAVGLLGITYGNGTYVAVGGTGVILASQDGATWTRVTSGTTNYLRGVTYYNGTFVAVGDQGAILTSSDGVNWEMKPSGGALSLSGVVFGNGSFVAVGQYGTILQSDPVVQVETVSAPDTPSGPAKGVTGVSYFYSTGGAISNMAHEVEYQFDWKGDSSDLSDWGSPTQSKTWTAGDVYNVRARARSVTNVSAISDWSNSLSVSINVPRISVTPVSYDFGNVKLKRSKSTSFRIKNIGEADLSIASVISGTDASMFAITSGGGSKTIKPGRSLTLRVVFKPASTGSKSAILEITSNDPVRLTVDIPLSGTGQ